MRFLSRISGGRVGPFVSGASLQRMQAILGHSTIAMTEKYAHNSPDHIARGAAKLQLSIQNGIGQPVAIDGGHE